MERSLPEKCPIDMTKVSYEILAIFMTNKKNKDGKYYSKSVYDGIRSSFMSLYMMCDLVPPPGFRERMTTLLKGFKRTIVDERVTNGEVLEEGKDCMSFECFNILCKKCFEGECYEYNFAHT